MLSNVDGRKINKCLRKKKKKNIEIEIYIRKREREYKPQGGGNTDRGRRSQNPPLKEMKSEETG